MIVIVSKKRFNDLNKVVLSAGKYIKALQEENVALRQAIEQAPQPQKPLTDEQIAEIIGNMKFITPSRIARAVEAAHGIHL